MRRGERAGRRLDARGRDGGARGRGRQPDRPPRRQRPVADARLAPRHGARCRPLRRPARRPGRARRGRADARAAAVRGRGDRLRRRGGRAVRHRLPRLGGRRRPLRSALAGACAMPTASRSPTCCAAIRRPRPRAADLLGYVEVHIEQGPVLERLGEPVGVVTAIAGQSHADVRFLGEAGHAGTVPHGRAPRRARGRRRVGARRRARRRPRPRSAGSRSSPAARNVIPARATLTLDVRDADDAARRARSRSPDARAHEIAARRGVELEWADTADIPAVAMDERLTARSARPRAPAQRRRPRRRDDGLDHARRDAVRALPRRHQPQPRRVGRGGRRGGGDRRRSSASCMPSDLLIRGGTVVLPGVFPVTADVAVEDGRSRRSVPSCPVTRARRSTPAACTCCPA